jgi:hypothetical protein
VAEQGPQTPGQAKRDARFIGDVPGCFVFLDRVGREWEAQTFAFSARSVSTSKAVVTSETAVDKGEQLALRFETIGIRRGVVERATADGFTVLFTEEKTGEANVDARIGWLNRKVKGRAEDRRDYRRVVPRHADAILVLGADNYAECKLRDVSRSGAAVSASVQPAIGSLLAVGSIPGRVVRHFEGGFAVRFLVVQVESELEALLTLRTAREKSLAAARLGFAA